MLREVAELGPLFDGVGSSPEGDRQVIEAIKATEPDDPGAALLWTPPLSLSAGAGRRRFVGWAPVECGPVSPTDIQDHNLVVVEPGHRDPRAGFVIEAGQHSWGTQPRLTPRDRWHGWLRELRGSVPLGDRDAVHGAPSVSCRTVWRFGSSVIWNENPRPFVWTKTKYENLGSIAPYRTQTAESRH